MLTVWATKLVENFQDTSKTIYRFCVIVVKYGIENKEREI